MRRLQLVAFGEPSEVVELNTFFEPVLGPEEDRSGKILFRFGVH